MDRTVQPHPHHLRDAARIVAVDEPPVVREPDEA